LRTLTPTCLLLAVSSVAWAACSQCAESALGGPADNRFTPFETVVPGGGGLPEILVNTASLNVFVRESDFRLGGAQGFGLERSYNLDDDRTGPFGTRWTFNLGERLTPDAENKVWTLRRGSGRLDLFAASAESGGFFAAGGTPLQLAQSSDGSYTVRGGGAIRTFRADGCLTAIERDGVRVTLEYDAAARLTAAHALGRSLYFGYSDGDRITSVADTARRGGGYTYSAEGYLTRHDHPDGTATVYQYDEAGRLTAIQAGDAAVAIAYTADPAGISITLPDGAVRTFRAGDLPRQVVAGGTTYVSNALGLVESLTDAAGNRTTHAYDTAGRRIRTTSPAGEIVRYEYNAAGNLTTVTLPGGGRWQADYDTSGSPVRIADPRGNAWRISYENGRPAATTDPLGSPASATYNPQGLIATLIDGNFNTRAFLYTNGLLSIWSDPLGNEYRYEYDGAARPISRTDPDGSVIRAGYYAANRPATITAGDASITPDASIARDGLGRVIQSPGVTYAWDAEGRLSALRLAAGEIRYEYDTARRLAKVSDWLGNFAAYRYTPDGLVQSINVSGGPLTVFQYDAGQSLRSLVTTGPDGNVVAGFRYTRDAAGNTTTLASLEPEATQPAILAAGYTYDAANRLLSREDGIAVSYDRRGRAVQVEGPVNAAFSWDAFGRLAGFNGVTYGYDDTGLRSARQAAEGIRRYCYDFSGATPRLLMETDASGAPTAIYVWGLGPLWKIDSGGSAYFYHLDGDGNVVALSSSAAGVVNRYRYDPLGTLASAQEAVANPLRARAAYGWIDDGDGLIYNTREYRFSQLGLTLEGAIALEPPLPRLLPVLRGPGAWMLTGGPR